MTMGHKRHTSNDVIERLEEGLARMDSVLQELKREVDALKNQSRKETQDER